MRVLICGGRDYRDSITFTNVMRRLDCERGPIACVISGGARGADTMAEAWAKELGRDLQVFAADWSLGKKAGPMRNARMLAEGRPDLVVAFPGGRGTADMVRRARAAGVYVIEVGA